MIDPETPEPTERPDTETPDTPETPNTNVPDESGAGYGNHGDAKD